MKQSWVKVPWIGGRQVDVVWRPVWSDVSEVPVCTVEYAEADVKWFGSGRAEVVLLELPITVRLPAAPKNGQPWFDLPVPVLKEMSMILRKITQPTAGAGADGPGVSDKSDWPAIVTYLTTTAYPDGTARQVSSMTLLADGNGWRGCLSDKDNGRVLWKTGPTLLDLIQAIEEAAASDDPSHWRQSSDAKWKNRKRS